MLTRSKAKAKGPEKYQRNISTHCFYNAFLSIQHRESGVKAEGRPQKGMYHCLINNTKLISNIITRKQGPYVFHPFHCPPSSLKPDKILLSYIPTSGMSLLQTAKPSTNFTMKYRYHENYSCSTVYFIPQLILVIYQSI